MSVPMAAGSDKLVILIERENHAILQFNRPQKRNAINLEMRKQILAYLDIIAERFRVCVITGSGPSFCAGVDLKELQAMTQSGEAEDRRYSWTAVNLAIRSHPSIFIAAVNGFALGGGLTLINMCDLAIADEVAEIGMPEMGFGMYPALAGPTTQLSAPRKAASWMVLTGKRISGALAAQWGLVNFAVPAAELMNRSDDIARHVAQFDAIALRESKRALDLVPAQVTGWQSAMELGDLVNSQITQFSDAQRAGLEKFRDGERNAGQGKVR